MKKSELKALIKEVVEELNTPKDPTQLAGEIIKHIDNTQFVEDIDLDFIRNLAQQIVDSNKH